MSLCEAPKKYRKESSVGGGGEQVACGSVEPWWLGGGREEDSGVKQSWQRAPRSNGEERETLSCVFEAAAGEAGAAVSPGSGRGSGRGRRGMRLASQTWGARCLQRRGLFPAFSPGWPGRMGLSSGSGSVFAQSP